MRQVFIIAAMAVILAGCASGANYSGQAMSLQMGMSKAQVVALMGQPKKTSARTDDDDLIERYSWWAPKQIGFSASDNEMMSGDRVAVKFVNGKVTEWGDSYDPGAMTDRAIEMQVNMLESIQNAYPQPATE